MTDQTEKNEINSTTPKKRAYLTTKRNKPAYKPSGKRRLYAGKVAKQYMAMTGDTDLDDDHEDFQKYHKIHTSKRTCVYRFLNYHGKKDPETLKYMMEVLNSTSPDEIKNFSPSGVYTNKYGE